MDPAKLRLWSIAVHVAAVAAGVGLALLLFDALTAAYWGH